MLNPREYVIGTFEPEDIEIRLDDGDCKDLITYIKDNNLEDIIILSAVSWLRDWFDDVSGDAYWEALKHALVRHVGKDKLAEMDWPF